MVHDPFAFSCYRKAQHHKVRLLQQNIQFIGCAGPVKAQLFPGFLGGVLLDADQLDVEGF